MRKVKEGILRGFIEPTAIDDSIKHFISFDIDHALLEL